MKKITIIIIVLLLIMLAVFSFSNVSVNISSKGAGIPRPETKENTEGPVSVTVTPLDWNFEVSLNTHSGSLDSDLVVLSELVDNQGKLYKPISWEGDNPGGHHRKGVLKFNPISPRPKSIELKIKDIGGVPERSFKWIF